MHFWLLCFPCAEAIWGIFIKWGIDSEEEAAILLRLLLLQVYVFHNKDDVLKKEKVVKAAAAAAAPPLICPIWYKNKPGWLAGQFSLGIRLSKERKLEAIIIPVDWLIDW